MIEKLQGLLLFIKVVLLMIRQTTDPSPSYQLLLVYLYSYLNDNKLLYLKQSSFRLMHSVLSCLLKCTNDWYLNLDKGNFTSVTFIDLKKAFDTVNHEILLKKTYLNGIKDKEFG